MSYIYEQKVSQRITPLMNDTYAFPDVNLTFF